MIKKIHILGASGSGTTTLGVALAEKMGYKHFDTDDFLWEPTTPPYQKKRSIEDRQKLLGEALESNEKWVLTGSMVGWGDALIAHFELVVYLWIPQDIRIQRLRQRERGRYGNDIEQGGSMHQTHLDFIEWASQYDTGDETMRSRKYHNLWLNNISCEVLRLEGACGLGCNVSKVLNYLQQEKER